MIHQHSDSRCVPRQTLSVAVQASEVSPSAEGSAGGYPLPADHPGAHDPEYLTRRAAIAAIGSAYHRGDVIPQVDYTAAEHDVWATVSRELSILHQKHACRAYLRGAAALVLPTERVPQLSEVDERVRALTGFRIDPVPGLVDTRTFYGVLADRHFLATQYVRHHSVPYYTPEPDIIHEIIGHANMLADPDLADLYEAAGHASQRAETKAALDFFSRVFWFTLEFGVVGEDGRTKAFGAGILSSFGELHTYNDPKLVVHRPFDLAAMGTMAYDITHYQPILFRAESTGQLLADLHDFFAHFDDDTPGRLGAGKEDR